MDRFWNKVNKQGPDECWEWTNGLNGNGYGSFNIEGKIHTAHRASYLLNVGPIPEGQVVRHSCDNRKCVNPAHLEVGTYSQNNQDIVNRGRRDYKLTIHDARAIREELERGCLQKVLAARYGVSNGLISQIKNNRTWTEGWRTT